MSYFKYFPTVDYKFGDNITTDPMLNMSAFADILSEIEDDASFYRLVQIQDGERPDQLSERLYGTSTLHWTFFMLNEKLRETGWPLSQQELISKMEEDIPGECLVIFGTATNAENGNEQHSIVGQFPIGSNIFGSISGAAGVVVAKNPLLGQIFVRKTNLIPFRANETAVDTLSVSPTYSVPVAIVHDPAYMAIHHVENGEGDNIDVDYSVDFRGQPSEGDTDLPGGVFDDPANPDIYADGSPYSIVSFFEHYTDVNDEQARIKVLVPNVAFQVTKLLKDSLNA